MDTNKEPNKLLLEDVHEKKKHKDGKGKETERGRILTERHPFAPDLSFGRGSQVFISFFVFFFWNLTAFVFFSSRGGSGDRGRTGVSRVAAYSLVNSS